MQVGGSQEKMRMIDLCTNASPKLEVNEYLDLVKKPNGMQPMADGDEDVCT